MRARRPGARKFFLALLATLALADLGLTLALRQRGGALGWRPLPPFGAITHARQREWLARQRAELDGKLAPDPSGVFDRELGWCTVPSSRGADGMASYGALGARGPREYEPEPPAGITRLACFGDSFTHCDRVSDAETWEHALESAWPECEALNFGVGGYGTDQALLRFRREGRHGAEVVCIGLMLENLGRNVNRYRPLWYPTTNACSVKPRFVLEGGALRVLLPPVETRAALIDAVEDGSIVALCAEHEYWLDRPALGVLRYSGFARLAGGWLAYRERDVERLWRDPEGEPFVTTLAIVETFAREALASGAKRALLVLFPREGDLESLVERGAPYWELLLRELDLRKIPYVDPSPQLAEAWRELEGRAAATLYTGGHLSGRGNEIVARAVRQAL